MLDTFLETYIQNKLNLLTILYTNHTNTFKELNHVLHLSHSKTMTMIEELNSDLQDLAEIKKNSHCFSLSVSKDVTFFQLFYSICKTSSTLRCLQFCINNDKQKPFSKFIEQEYLTKSTAYRIRQNCRNYLNSIGLDLKHNHVVGEEYRIRFLIALLHYKYNIDCCDIDHESVRIARNFILSTNQMIDLKYLEQTANEYGYFECLLILSWKRQRYPVSFLNSDILEGLKELFIYKELKQTLKKTIEPTLQIEFSESDYDYIYLTYCCTNSCLFADQWSQKDVKQVHDIIFSEAAFSDLLQTFETRFGKEIPHSHALRATLIYFYKKCLMELQCIIPDKNFFIDFEKSPFTNSIVELLTTIINSWREKNHIRYKIDKDHLLYLSLQIEFILRQFIPPIQVFILSDLNAELEVMNLYLTRCFSPQKITIVPFRLNAQNKDLLCSQKNSIMIVHRKFRQVIDSLKLAEQNTVVLITAEMNDLEITTIQNAITDYEKERFLELINGS